MSELKLWKQVYELEKDNEIDMTIVKIQYRLPNNSVYRNFTQGLLGRQSESYL